MTGEIPDDLHRRIRQSLSDPTRKSARAEYRFAYTEEQFDRKLMDESPFPLNHDLIKSQSIQYEQLLKEQIKELLQSLGLTDRQVKICRMRLEGYTAMEISQELGLSERRIRALLHDLRRMLEIRLKEPESGGDGERDPYYGWQEVYLKSQQR